MSKTKTTMRIAVVAALMAVAAFATKPAQAKFGMVLGYKYVAVNNIFNYEAHVGQLDFMWTIGGGDQGYRDGGKRPHQAFGFGLAVGRKNGLKPPTENVIGLTSSPTSEYDQSPILDYFSDYYAASLIYEYVFPFGLGITGGLTVPFMVVGDKNTGAAGVGISVSDVGLSYHFKNGLTFYTKVDTGYTRFGNKIGLLSGVGAGLGYWF